MTEVGTMTINSLELATCTYTVNGSQFQVPERYRVFETLGEGNYAVVCVAEDEGLKENVAIKKIESGFEHITYTKRTLRELRILRHLQHENLIDVRNIFMVGTKDEFEDIYVVSELMETDLASILRSNQPLNDEHRHFFLYQILRGMKYVHSAQVIHRDLKPRNLLVNSNCDLKICDFGLARVTFEQDKEFMTSPMIEYICTRWYRAPEVLCSWVHYTKAVDVWSIGCIFAEMLGRDPLFASRNTQHQVKLIVDVLGTPSDQELAQIQNKKCRSYIRSLPHSQGVPFVQLFQNEKPNAIDILHRMLMFDPDKRLTVVKALEHPYLSELYCPEDEPVREPLDTTDFEFERRKVSMEGLREELWLEALCYYPFKRDLYLREQRKIDPARRHDIKRYRLLNQGESQYSSDEEGNNEAK